MACGQRVLGLQATGGHLRSAKKHPQSCAGCRNPSFLAVETPKSTKIRLRRLAQALHHGHHSRRAARETAAATVQEDFRLGETASHGLHASESSLNL